MRGFTLIELLVTMTIIVILATVGFLTYSDVQKSSRDAKRQADLRIMQSALEQFRADHLYYPTRNPSVGNPPCNSNGQLQFNCSLKSLDGTKTYLNLIPLDPTYKSNDSASNYYYDAKPGSINPCQNDPDTCRTYCIYARLEKPTSTAIWTIDCPSSGSYNYLVTPP